MAAPVIIRNLRDTYVDQTKPKRNFINTSRVSLSGKSQAQKQALIFFGKPWPAGTTITSAKLRVWNAHAWGGSVTLTAQRITRAWAGNRVHWDSRPEVNVPTISVTKSNAPYATMWEIDVTPIVQMVADGEPWYGIKLSINGDATRGLYSTQADLARYRPQVVVQWSDAPEPPEDLSPAGGRDVASPKPVLSYTFIDNSGDVSLAAHQIQITATETGFGAPVFDSGWTTTSVPEFDTATSSWAGLGSGGKVWWRVRVRDGAGVESKWSEPAEFGYTPKGTVVSDALGLKLVAVNQLTDPRALGGSWTGLNNQGITGTIPSNIYYSENIGAAQGSTWSVGMRLRNLSSSTVNVTGIGIGPTTDQLFYSNTPVTPYVSLSLLPGESKTVYHTSALPSGANGFRVRFVTPGGTPDGAIKMEMATVVAGTYTGELFDGAMEDTEPQGPSIYNWTGGANASTSTLEQYFVEDTSPPIFWTLSGGGTQTAYRVVIQDLELPDRPVFDSGKVTSTLQSIDTSGKVVTHRDRIYRLSIWVWDDINREKNNNEGVPSLLRRDFVYSPGSTITPPSGLQVTPNYPWPWLNLSFSRTSPPDSFTIFRDGVVVENNIDPADLHAGGTNYLYIDRTAPPRYNHTWQVVANVNNRDSQPSNSVVGQSKPSVTWMMNPDASSPICLVKSASEPTPVVDAQSMSMQEIHQPIGGGSPVLITQYLSGYEGHVDAVLADDIAPGLSAREMRNRFKYWKRNPGSVVLLFMVDEVIRVVPYNMTYRPRAKSGGQVLYDISFDFFEDDD